MILRTVTMRLASHKDEVALHAAMARLGPCSIDYPADYPGDATVNLPTGAGGVTEAQLQAAADAAASSAPDWVKSPPAIDQGALRRAMAKASRGKPLTDEESAVLDRAEVE